MGEAYPFFEKTKKTFKKLQLLVSSESLVLSLAGFLGAGNSSIETPVFLYKEDTMVRICAEGTLFATEHGIYIDTCSSDAEHILRPTVEDTGYPARCRVYLDQALKPLIGKTGKFLILVLQNGEI